MRSDDFRARVSVVMLSFNEAENVGRSLSRLTSFPEVVLVDSLSTDDTVSIASSFSNVRVLSRKFDTHATQWNFGVEQCGPRAEWILALDADYVLTSGFLEEFAGLDPAPETVGYRSRFLYRIKGRPLRAALYPAVVVLFRRGHGRFLQQGHTQRLEIAGRIEELKALIEHDDRKPLSRWLAAQQRYAFLEADFLLENRDAPLRRSDRVRLMGWPAPLLVFFYTLFAKRCILDGWPGWIYVAQRTCAELMIALAILEKRIPPRP